ncbi:glutathione S-transferase family protein [Reinekea marinisedimentorum]|uniref:Glutathione S-transferase n=1 Tax=Reinekea marinisedimentorum TaxID=230495 RepID=A0A4R3IDM3_9GAMM|nr:glutathione S-transferase family protein [Reinekea marinisedimentorum]TCS43876.1 glutathione S-transferase [Reinekea marinisedimentorum]
MNITLVTANKNYSTWSLRPWLLLKAFKVHFNEVYESLNGDDLRERLLKHSATAKVPVLVENSVTIWDSLAICEYVSEVHLEGQGWPKSPIARAKARAITCEMHSGFSALRNAMPMNIRARRRIEMTADIERDIARIDEIWSAHHASGWLFEEFSIADCFYAPVAFRFETYGVKLSEAATQYQHKLLAHPAMVAWKEKALAETEIVAMDEAGEELN